LAEGFSERNHRRAGDDGFVEVEKRCFHTLSIRVGLAKLEPREIGMAPMTLDGVVATSYVATNFPPLWCCSQEGKWCFRVGLQKADRAQPLLQLH
jgi:hypothetical protein